MSDDNSSSSDTEESDHRVMDAHSSSEEEEKDEEGSVDDAGEEEGDEIEHRAQAPRVDADGEDGDEVCTFDLRNLIAINSHQVDPRRLYSRTGAGDGEGTEAAAAETTVNEEFLLQKSSEGCQRLIAALWDLPREKSSSSGDAVGPLAVLPATFEIVTPRELPPPPPKKETKWEKFAKERGIETKRKRERKVYDEATGEWMYRHGYQKANAQDREWPIMEVKKNDDPYADPWEKAREAKRSRVERNLEARMRNEERAGTLPRGTAARAARDRTAAREKGKAGHAKGSTPVAAVVPGGIPVDLRSETKRGKDLTRAALAASQRSTASLGRFDRMREGEPERRTTAMRRRKFESATATGVAARSESERGMKVLQNVISGAAKRADRAKRDGSLAKGETAYDYDYDDGLGPSTFRKKKGRAGAGKLKKVTKKRAK